MTTNSLYWPLSPFHYKPPQCVVKIMLNPEPHGNKIYNLVGEYQAGNQLVSAAGLWPRLPHRHQR